MHSHSLLDVQVQPLVVVEAWCNKRFDKRFDKHRSTQHTSAHVSEWYTAGSRYTAGGTQPEDTSNHSRPSTHYATRSGWVFTRLWQLTAD